MFDKEDVFVAICAGLGMSAGIAVLATLNYLGII